MSDNVIGRLVGFFLLSIFVIAMVIAMKMIFKGDENGLYVFFAGMVPGLMAGEILNETF